MTQGINSLGSGAENPIQIWFSSYQPIPEFCWYSNQQKLRIGMVDGVPGK
jgi:hypothetical protein